MMLSLQMAGVGAEYAKMMGAIRAPMIHPAPRKWHHGVTRYQWLLLLIASAGWAFDAFEGQIFNLTRGDLLADLLHVPMDSPEARRAGDMMLGIFLMGGAVGGLLFSSLADRWGRKPIMAITILCYSLFSGLTFFAQELWQVGILRFIVAMAIAGEWAVAATLVAEAFPQSARAQAGGLYHSSSVPGIWLATAVAISVGTEWRWAYVWGLLPALLVFWVRSSIHESEIWQAAQAKKNKRLGSYRELLTDSRWRSRAIFGMLLAMVGMATFWGVTVASQDLCKEALLREGVSSLEAASKAKFAYGFITTTGCFLGMVSFGPISAYLGRKNTFALMLMLALFIVPMTCWIPQTYAQMLFFLPFLGFFTTGIHAGFAIYFPELFPSHLRASGVGFCFNAGRLIAGPILFVSGEIKSTFGLSVAVTLLSLFYLIGLFTLFFLPETKNSQLPD